MIRAIAVLVTVFLLARVAYHLFSVRRRGTTSSVFAHSRNSSSNREAASIDEDVSDVQWKVSPPSQCILWEQPELVYTSGRFECIQTFEDESHLQRSLLRCRECGQKYFYEFYEIVDWDDGDDKQYSTYIPVATPEQIEAMRGSSVYELLRFFPRLQEMKWIGK
jgi:hypothetical protein